jgi:3-hydroxyisobutyrate dehydrogenase
MDKVIGFIGLGAMGSKMIAHLPADTHRVLFDLDAERAQAIAKRLVGEVTVATTLDGFAKAQVVILMLPDSAVVDAVVLGQAGSSGLMHRLAPGSLLIDMSSSEPMRTQALAAKAVERGIAFLDAPVSGGTVGAEKATLAIMVGGQAPDVERARGLLACMGSQVTHVGGYGAGHALKGLNNLLAATIFAATSEVFAAGERFGLDPAVMHQVINASSGGSFVTNTIWPRSVLPKTWNFGFALALMHKDVGIGMSLVRAGGADARLLEESAVLWDEAKKQSASNADLSDYARLMMSKMP